MLDRSSFEDLPEEWDHGLHRARTADGFGTGPADAYGAVLPHALGGRTDSYGAGQTDALGAWADSYDAGQTGALGGRTDSYGAGMIDALGGQTDSYGAGQTDALGAWADSYDAGQTDALGGRTDSYGAGMIGAYRVRSADAFGAGAADPFGDADRFADADPFGPRTVDPFGSRAADPFGPAPATVASGMAEAETRTARMEAGTARMEAEPPVTIRDPAPGQKADARGFLGALFDFGFTSFVTPKVIKVLYMLIVIGTVLSALVFTVLVFKASVAFGVLTLVFGDPLFILIVLALYRIILEFFVVTFRVAEDIRALRERGDLH
jgi:hypothetical protein